MVDLNTAKKMLIDGVLNAATERGKQELVKWLKNTGIPAARDVAAAYTARLKEQSAEESGWNKIRDSLFLPSVISVALWVAETAADKIIAAQAAAE